MGNLDIDRAREGSLALRRIVEAYAGPRADLRALRRVRAAFAHAGFGAIHAAER